MESHPCRELSETGIEVCRFELQTKFFLKIREIQLTYYGHMPIIYKVGLNGKDGVR
jgi:hypothetical protein